MPESNSSNELTGLGPLEQRLMRIVWQLGEVSVRDVHQRLNETLAYTTLMTTLDRLHKKGLLERRKEGRAFFYSPRLTPGEFERSIARGLIERLLGRVENEAEPMLACIVEAVSERDRALLDDLDRLIREKRRALREEE